VVKAIGLLSGGLDSTLAVKIIIEHGIEVIALNFVTPFCTCSKKGCQNQAKKVAERFGIELKVVSVGAAFIKLVKNPQYGYGSNMNPCIDCRILMFSIARQYMEEIGAEFVFTGEVLDQRPMSQNLTAMRLIERASRLTGRLLRPLSARFFEPTIPEKQGLVKRELLLAIQGRSRKPQITLCRQKQIYDYPCPAGGCRLTDPNFARRLKEAFDHNEDSIESITLLRYGRHFRLPTGIKVVVGRNQQENLILKNLAGGGHYFVIEPKEIPGPVAILTRNASWEDVEMAAKICLSYSDYDRGDGWSVVVNESQEMPALPLAREKLRDFLIN
jgi:tRNA(Ile)-lysidine synthase TilS/MesJ